MSGFGEGLGVGAQLDALDFVLAFTIAANIVRLHRAAERRNEYNELRGKPYICAQCAAYVIYILHGTYLVFFVSNFYLMEIVL